MLDNGGLHYCKKAFQIQSKSLHWGVYEGQCTKDGKTCGFGRWVITNPEEERYAGMTYTGCFNDDMCEGYAFMTAPALEASSAGEFSEGTPSGKLTAYEGGKISN